MMEATLREYLTNRFKPDEFHEGYNDEQFANLLGDYFSSKGMEWTKDDEQAVRDFGYDPDLYLDFTCDQWVQQDIVENAVGDMVAKLLELPQGMTVPTGYRTAEDIVWSEVAELADVVAGFLASKGFAVYYPTKHEKNGVKYITDLYEKE